MQFALISLILCILSACFVVPAAEIIFKQYVLKHKTKDDKTIEAIGYGFGAVMCLVMAFI